MTKRQAARPASGLLEADAKACDDLCGKLNQREAFRRYLEGRLLPAERTKTLTALANAEPIVGAQAVTTRRVELLRADPATAPAAAGVLVLDATGDRTWGTKTAPVGRQYLGSSGKVESGVVSVTSVWADARVYYPLAVEPFTPKQRLPRGMADPAYRTKPQIAVELVTQAVSEGGSVRAVVADSCYGENDTLRTGLAGLGVGSVLALKPAHAWWAPVGTVNSLEEVARTGDCPHRRLGRSGRAG